jgi:hypothetical protein
MGPCSSQDAILFIFGAPDANVSHAPIPTLYCIHAKSQLGVSVQNDNRVGIRDARYPAKSVLYTLSL